MSSRISRDELLMGMAQTVAMRGTCERLRVGAIVSRDGRSISEGYVGSPPGMPHCIDEGCVMENDHCIGTTHAEINALLFAARNGIATNGAEIFITHSPCYSCAKAIVTAGITRVVWFNEYRKDADRSKGLFVRANIEYGAY